MVLGKNASARDMEEFDEQQGSNKPLFWGRWIPTRAFADEQFSPRHLAAETMPGMQWGHDGASGKAVLSVSDRVLLQTLFGLRKDTDYRWRFDYRLAKGSAVVLVRTMDGRTLIHEGADIAFRLGQHQGAPERSLSRGWGANSGLRARLQERDRRKAELCRAHGVTLICVPNHILPGVLGPWVRARLEEHGFVVIPSVTTEPALAFALACTMLPLPDADSAGYIGSLDDPEPVEYQHWEFYLASLDFKTAGDWSGTAPHVEVNYGVVSNVLVQQGAMVSSALVNTGGGMAGR